MNKGDVSLPKRHEVVQTLLSKWEPEIVAESVKTADALDRVIAENAFAVIDLPVVRASSMDGVGVISSMFKDGLPDTSGWVAGKEYIRADTGDDFDDKFDAVVAIERVRFEDGRIIFDDDLAVRPGMSIRPKGDSIRKGELLVKKHTRLIPSDLAALAAGGIAEIHVIKKPVVAFIPTGSELIPAGTMPGRGQTIDSNSVLVGAMLAEMGAEPLCLPIVRDNMDLLSETLDEALAKSDIVILNGGSSKGEEDFNARLLEQKGEVLFHWVAAAPGKPMCVAIIEAKPVINIPGPPLAAYYGMDWCVRAAVNRVLRQPTPVRKTVRAKLTEDIRVSQSTEILCKMELHKTVDGYETRQAPFMRSTVIENLTAPGQYITKLGLGGHKAGEILEVELLRDEGSIM